MTNHPSPNPPVLRLGDALHDMVQAFQDAQTEAARRNALHPTDFACIGFLHRRAAPVSAKEITSYLRLSSGSGTALLDRLETAGLIRRQPNPRDRRGVLITLDDLAALDPVRQFQAMQHGFHALIAPLSESDLEVISKFLTGVAELALRPPGGSIDT